MHQDNDNVFEKIDLDKVDWQSSREFFESLSDELKASTEATDERYDFTWVGKRKAILEAGAPINKTLCLDKEDSRDWNTTENLYIEGDNLEALKLLQQSYLGKIKMIYIDPPYNTGKDFIYRDNFKASVEDYNEATEYKDEDGNIQFKKNSKDNGRYHSDWLTMMYSRLKLARNLLSEDGVIFISIDDNEQANLKKLCDEVFGEDNFMFDLIRKTKSTTNDNNNGINIQHEICLVFVKNKNIGRLEGEKKDFSKYKNPDDDPAGAWVVADPSARTGAFFEIKNPYTGKIDLPPENSHWRFSGESFKSHVRSGKIKFKKTHKPTERGFIFKRYLDEIQEDKHKVNSLAFIDNKYMNQAATKALNKLLPFKAFDYSKPIDFLIKLLSYGTSDSDIILDFFSGSATTAHAVMQLNAEDGGNRKYIMVQLPEECDEKSEAFKAGYKTIPEIARERIRRAGDKILEDFADKLKDRQTPLDIGFRTLKITETNYKDVHTNPSELKQEDLLAQVDNLKPDRSDLDLLYGVLTQKNFSLNSPIQVETINNQDIYLYDYLDINTGIIACFAEEVTPEVYDFILTKKPALAVFKDKSFKSLQDKLNLHEKCRPLNITVFVI